MFRSALTARRWSNVNILETRFPLGWAVLDSDRQQHGQLPVFLHTLDVWRKSGRPDPRLERWPCGFAAIGQSLKPGNPESEPDQTRALHRRFWNPSFEPRGRRGLRGKCPSVPCLGWSGRLSFQGPRRVFRRRAKVDPRPGLKAGLRTMGFRMIEVIHAKARRTEKSSAAPRAQGVLC